MGAHPMTVKRINSLLSATAIGCCALAGIAVVAAVVLPLDLGEGGANAVAEHTGAARRPTSMPAGDAGETYLSHLWRGPVGENVAANAQAVPAAGGVAGGSPGAMTL